MIDADDIKEAAIEAAAKTPELVEAVTDRLWGFYEQGVVGDGGIWCDAGMRDAEALVGIIGLDTPKADADRVQELILAAIPRECAKIARDAIEAYEDAMCAAVEQQPIMDMRFHSYDVNVARVRLFGLDGHYDIPLPQPPEQKT